jgi:hypothetical protein
MDGHLRIDFPGKEEGVQKLQGRSVSCIPGQQGPKCRLEIRAQ